MPQSSPAVKHSDDPLSLESPDLPALGWPFTSYSRLLLAADDAKRKLHAAQINGTVNERAEAELALDDALNAFRQFKHHAANTFLLLARLAAEVKPGAVQALLDPAARRELDVTQEAVVEHEDRIDEVENAVAALAVGEVVK